MRHIKLIGILWVLCGFARSACAAEFFYSNVIHPSSGQIVITIDSIGGHRSAIASTCASQEQMWCY